MFPCSCVGTQGTVYSCVGTGYRLNVFTTYLYCYCSLSPFQSESRPFRFLKLQDMSLFSWVRRSLVRTTWKTPDEVRPIVITVWSVRAVREIDERPRFQHPTHESGTRDVAKMLQDCQDGFKVMVMA